jgi:hypothetical protein
LWTNVQGTSSTRTTGDSREPPRATSTRTTGGGPELAERTTIEGRATKTARASTSEEKISWQIITWVHTFGKCKVNFAKLLEMPFFLLPIWFSELANSNKWPRKNAKLLEMTSFFKHTYYEIRWAFF